MFIRQSNFYIFLMDRIPFYPLRFLSEPQNPPSFSIDGANRCRCRCSNSVCRIACTRMMPRTWVSTFYDVNVYDRTWEGCRCLFLNSTLSFRYCLDWCHYSKRNSKIMSILLVGPATRNFNWISPDFISLDQMKSMRFNFHGFTSVAMKMNVFP